MITAILQARVSSRRLPCKVLREIMGIPMILLEIERIKRSLLIDQLVVATSTEESDDSLASLCCEKSIPCYRGSLDDVLDRFYQVATQYGGDHIVRITGDCPLIDHSVIDQVITYYLNGNFDYVSNALEPTFPDGMDVEVFSLPCLEQAWVEAMLTSEREHVTPFIYKNSNRFQIGNYRNSMDISGLRWTVDELLDFELVHSIYKGLYPYKPDFRMDDILEFLEKHPYLKQWNTQYQRNEGYHTSLLKDK